MQYVCIHPMLLLFKIVQTNNKCKYKCYKQSFHFCSTHVGKILTTIFFLIFYTILLLMKCPPVGNIYICLYETFMPETNIILIK